jgi:hypothetical protein
VGALVINFSRGNYQIISTSAWHTTAATRVSTTVLSADKPDECFIQVREGRSIAKFISDCRHGYVSGSARPLFKIDFNAMPK